MARAWFARTVLVALLAVVGCGEDAAPADTGNGGFDLPQFDTGQDVPDTGGEDVPADTAADAVEDPSTDLAVDQGGDLVPDGAPDGGGDLGLDIGDAADLGTEDAPPPVDVAPDADLDTFVPPTPPAPVVSSPTAGSRVATPLAVVGTAEASAEVSATLLGPGSTVLGTTSGDADETGTFALALDYPEDVTGTAYSLRVFQTNRFDVDSPAAAINLTQGGAPATPTITVPTEGAEVVSPLTVSGSAEVGATVTITLTDPDDSDAVLATETRSATGDGRYSAVLTFESPAGDELDLEVVAENEFGASAPATRSLAYGSFTVSGRLFNNCGSGAAPPCLCESGAEPPCGEGDPFDGLRTDGDFTYVRAYTGPNSVSHVAEVVVETPSGADVDATYELSLPSGTYYLRAFRDATGYDADTSDGLPGAPDGEPTLPVDLQTMGTVTVVIDDASETGVDLELEDVSAAGTGLFFFDGYAFNETFVASPPGSGGSGLCGGFHLFFEGIALDGGGYSDPVLVLPNGETRVMGDDGGCASGGNNTANSFDRTADDNTWSYGILNPTELDAGRYRIVRRHTSMNVLAGMGDDIDELVRFPRSVRFVSPDTTDNVSNNDPVDWEDVTGAGAYFLRYGELNNAATFTVEGPLTESMWDEDAFANLKFYEALLEIYDADPESSPDIDARGRTVPFYWSTDRTGGDSVTISGTFANRTGATAPIMLEASSFSGGRVSQWVAAGSTEWTITYYYPDSNTSDIQVRAFLDVDRSGSPDTPGNAALRDQVSNILRDSPTSGYELVFENRVLLVAPVQNADVGRSPTLTWAPLSGEVPSGEYQFMVRVDNITTSGIEAIWAVDSSATSLTFGSLEGATDVGVIVSCSAAGGLYTDEGCSVGGATASLERLAASTSYRWQVFVSECDTTAADDDADENGQDDLVDCLLGYGRGSLPAFNSSEERDFNVN
jgi:hypothetical protein